jgi:hypothetical protein
LAGVREPDPRSILVFAAPDDPDRTEQLAALDADADAVRARDVIVVDVAQRLDALALCELHGVAPGEFEVVLIDRDGEVRERWSAPVAPSDVWALLDDDGS